MNLPMNKWALWFGLNVAIASFFFYALFAPASPIKTSLLPGTTTHGHYQIEMDCDACHLPAKSSEKTNAVGAVMQDACKQCHAEQLRRAKDTHPAKKFNDPTNAELLLTLNAQDCLTCHKEHVPDQTLPMGLTVPSDYCWHCHQDVGESRPSHQGMAFDSCATAGCHNYHDNRALYEKYLDQHFGEPDFLEQTTLPSRNFAASWASSHQEKVALTFEQADAPDEKKRDPTLLSDWSQTAHSRSGVNCNDCHESASAEDAQSWSDAVSMETCETCHSRQVETFVAGRHGMRLAVGLSPMTPAQARHPMHSDALHRELTCNSCHPGHRFDSAWAAVDACRQCHSDPHTLAYEQSPHAELWRKELAGELPAGSGVSCATCHLPRLSDGKEVFVNHDQNANLRPNESMARDVCQSCHGLEFSLSSLADTTLLDTCYDGSPDDRVESVTMAHEWFEQQEKKRQQRKQKRQSTNAKTQP